MSRRSVFLAVAAQLGLTPLFLWVWYGTNSVSMKLVAVAVFIVLEIGIAAFGIVAELKKRSSTKN